MVYELKNKEVRVAPHGTLELPFLYAVTSGERNNDSLVFHLKIGETFHQCHIDQVNKNSCNLCCAVSNCPSRHKIRLDPQYIITKPGGIKKKMEKFVIGTLLTNRTQL